MGLFSKSNGFMKPKGSMGGNGLGTASMKSIQLSNNILRDYLDCSRKPLESMGFEIKVIDSESFMLVHGEIPIKVTLDQVDDGGFSLVVFRSMSVHNIFSIAKQRGESWQSIYWKILGEPVLYIPLIVKEDGDLIIQCAMRIKEIDSNHYTEYCILNTLKEMVMSMKNLDYYIVNEL